MIYITLRRIARMPLDGCGSQAEETLMQLIDTKIIKTGLPSNNAAVQSPVARRHCNVSVHQCGRRQFFLCSNDLSKCGYKIR